MEDCQHLHSSVLSETCNLATNFCSPNLAYRMSSAQLTSPKLTELFGYLRISLFNIKIYCLYAAIILSPQNLSKPITGKL